MRSEKVVTSALEGGNRLTRDELATVFERRKLDPGGQRMPYLLMHCELEGVIGSGGRNGKQQTYALLDERVPSGGRRLDRDEAVVELVRRYLASHGPATVKDLSWWSGLTMTDLRAALGSLEDEVASDEVDGLTFWSTAQERSRRPAAARGVHLLQTYDELVVGYTESRFHGDTSGDLARQAWSDRTYPTGVFLLHGGSAGIGGARSSRRASARRSTRTRQVERRRRADAGVGGRASRALPRASRDGRDLAVPAALASRYRSQMRTDLKIDDLDGFLDSRSSRCWRPSGRDGSVLLSPVWHEWRDGGFQVWSGANDVKTRHLRREPRASIVVAESGHPLRGVEVRGIAEIVTEDAFETAVRIATRYLGPGKGEAYVRKVGGNDITIRLEPGDLRIWDFADEDEGMGP